MIPSSPPQASRPAALFQNRDIVLTPEADKIITVEVVDEHGVILDGERVEQGQLVKISIKQWRALSRHFHFIDGPAEHAPHGWVPPVKSAAQ